MKTDFEAIWMDIAAIRAQAPLVHNITNYVVMNVTANALLSLGASPVMAHAEEEVEDMVRLAGALVINQGTLSAPWITSMRRAMYQARALDVPIVFDPVGAGATPFRTRVGVELIRIASPTILRGNASEIRSLADALGAVSANDGASTKGVDSRHPSEAALEAARALSQECGCVVCVSGAVDYCVQAEQTIEIHNGHALMPRVTGLGCVASSLCGAFAAVNAEPLQAAAHAMAVMGICGELAAEKATGPGSLQVHFLDALYNLNQDQIRAYLRAGG
ncbi:MAG: hydroxyethylthiazole kinase [Chloroflexota bacterium]